MLQKRFLRERVELFSLLVHVVFPCVVAGNEVVQISAFQRIRFQREMLIGTEVVNPRYFCPGLLAG